MTAPPAGLQCPDCGVALQETQVFGEQRFGCTGCGGLAVPLASLGRFADPKIHAVVKDALAHAAGPSDRSCARCRHALARVELVLSGLVVNVDACRRCELLWFDKGELEQLPRRPRYDTRAAEEAQKLLAGVRRDFAKRRALQKEADAKLPVASPLAMVLAFLGLQADVEREAPKHRPWVTWFAVIAIAVVALLQRGGAIAADDLGFDPAHWSRDAGATAITYFLVHGGWFHLLVSFCFLAFVGDDVEERIGSMKFLALVLLGTLLGAAGYAFSDSASAPPLIGANAGISAILTFRVLSTPGPRFLDAPLSVAVVRVPALGLLAIWLILQLIGAMLHLGEFTMVSALAHLGGAVAGVVLWIAWRERAPSPDF